MENFTKATPENLQSFFKTLISDTVVSEFSKRLVSWLVEKTDMGSVSVMTVLTGSAVGTPKEKIKEIARDMDCVRINSFFLQHHIPLVLTKEIDDTHERGTVIKATFILKSLVEGAVNPKLVPSDIVSIACYSIPA